MDSEDTKLTPGVIRAGIKAVWRYLEPHRKDMAILVGLGVISAIGNGSIPYISGRFFDSLIQVSSGVPAFAAGLPLWGALLGAWAVTQIIAQNVDWIMDRMRRAMNTRLMLDLQGNGFIHLLHLPIAFHKREHINGVIEKISRTSYRVGAIVRVVIDIAPQLLSIVIGITLAISISPLLASVLAGGVAIYTAILIYMLVPMAKLDEEAHRVWNTEWDRGAAVTQQIDSVKNAAAEDYESERIRESFGEKIYRLWYRMERYWSNVGFFQRVTVFATQLVIFILAVRLVGEGVITVGELVALNGYSMMFFGPFAQLGYSWQVIQTGLISAAHAEEVFSEKQEIYEPEGGVELAEVRGEVVFDNVGFHYEAGQPQVLHDISFSVNPGEVVALVGASGVGKSSTISLISAFQFPTEGTVTVDGVDTRRVNLLSLRRQIGVVPQEVALFNDTLRYNLSYGTPEASEEELKNVITKAHLDEFVATLPKGIETTVGERGVKLSVGQKQRVAIARAMLRKPRILILDEPTSALDARTERFITESLEELMKDRTTFIIAHRLSTVRRADKILVFDKGRIVETGKHDELIHIEGGLYRDLYEHQVGLHA